MIYIAGLSIFGVAQYDITCYFKQKAEPKDFSVQINELKATQDILVEKMAEIRDDSSIGRLAESFRRPR